MDWLPTKKKINRQHRRRFADIETISAVRTACVLEMNEFFYVGRIAL